MDEHRKNSFPSWRLRNDLEFHPSDHGGDTWVIKDPLKLSYFYVESEELAFLRGLNGSSTWEGVKQGLKDRFPNVEFSDVSLQRFLVSGVKSGLLISDGVGYGELLARTRQAEQKSAVFRKLPSLLSHRFRGIDPTAILRFLDRHLGWVYDRSVQCTAIAFVAIVALLVISRWQQVLVELPTILELFTPTNLVILTLAVSTIKILHELAHGLTCRHFGGECHELGCIVVGFLPLLYCDVSDSWLQKARMRRAQVAFAGIAVELFIAAVFGILWVASVPGVTHSFFLNIMLLCSLNTILVNGNPLLRYDGYYVLSDLLRIPNLGPECRHRAVSLIQHVVLGTSADSDPDVSAWRRIWMPVFGFASMAYRWIVLATILMFINAASKPLRLEGISYFLAISVALGLTISVAHTASRIARLVFAKDGVNFRAASGIFVATIVLLAGVLWPLPESTQAPFTLSPGVSSPVYIQTAGFVTPKVAYNYVVFDGQQLGTLTNPGIDLELARLEGELAVARARIINLDGTRQATPTSSNALPAAQKAVENALQRLKLVRGKALRLSLTSPREGLVIPPRNRVAPKFHNNELQQFWTGTPLDEKNCNTWLEEQTIIAWIGNLTDLRALSYIDQQDIEFVQIGAKVIIYFHSKPSHTLTGKVTHLTTTPETSVTRIERHRNVARGKKWQTKRNGFCGIYQTRW